MINRNSTFNYHDQLAESFVWPIYGGHWDTQFTYTFENFFHPLVGKLISKLNERFAIWDA